MKTFKILYDFYIDDIKGFGLGRAVVMAPDEDKALQIFRFNCENYSHVIRIDEMKSEQIIFAY